MLWGYNDVIGTTKLIFKLLSWISLVKHRPPIPGCIRASQWVGTPFPGLFSSYPRVYFLPENSPLRVHSREFTLSRGPESSLPRVYSLQGAREFTCRLLSCNAAVVSSMVAMTSCNPGRNVPEEKPHERPHGGPRTSILD
jgi:hypothetical protein